MRPSRATLLVLLCATACASGLAACGDKSPEGVPTDSPFRPEAGLPPGSLPPGAGEEFAARLKEAVEKRLREGGAPTMPAGLEPLKASDVELYLKLRPDLHKTGGDIAALTTLLEPHGLTAMQWVMLQARVTGAAMNIKHGPVPAQLQADAAVVRPYLERVLEAIKGR